MAKTPQAKLDAMRRYRERNREKLRESERQYSRTHAEQRRAYSRQYAQDNPDAIKIRGQKRIKTMRERLFARFGDKCACCGFNDLRALQIDHCNGGGSKARNEAKNTWHYYKQMLEAPDCQLQILCANCNQIKRHEKKEHRRGK